MLVKNKEFLKMLQNQKKNPVFKAHIFFKKCQKPQFFSEKVQTQNPGISSLTGRDAIGPFLWPLSCLSFWRSHQFGQLLPATTHLDHTSATWVVLESATTLAWRWNGDVLKLRNLPTDQMDLSRLLSCFCGHPSDVWGISPGCLATAIKGFTTLLTIVSVNCTLLQKGEQLPNQETLL